MKKILILLSGMFLLASCGTDIEKTADNFSLNYPENYSDLGKDAVFISEACDSNSVENVAKIIPELEDYGVENLSSQNINLNGVNYLKFSTSDAGAGHVYETYYYSTLLDNSECFIIKLDTDITNCENYLPLEEGNTEQEKNYNKCVNTRENKDSIISDLEKSFKFQ